MQTEELIYCMHCGTANKKSAVTCIECEKKLNTKGSPFLDYVKDHIKDDLQGKVKDNVFSALKNYLLSHLYGAVLALCVIATVGMSIYAARPPKGVAPVKLHPYIAELKVQTASPGAPDIDAIIDPLVVLMDSYDLYVDALSNEHGDIPEPTRASDDLFAQPHLPAYAANAPHDFLDSEFFSVDLPPNDIGYQGSVPLRFETMRYGKDCTTDLANRLHKDGYQVVEINATAFWTAGAERDVTDETLIADAFYTEEYHFTFVEIDGIWYIASDVRI